MLELSRAVIVQQAPWCPRHRSLDSAASPTTAAVALRLVLSLSLCSTQLLLQPCVLRRVAGAKTVSAGHNTLTHHPQSAARRLWGFTANLCEYITQTILSQRSKSCVCVCVLPCLRVYVMCVCVLTHAVLHSCGPSASQGCSHTFLHEPCKPFTQAPQALQQQPHRTLCTYMQLDARFPNRGSDSCFVACR